MTEDEKVKDTWIPVTPEGTVCYTLAAHTKTEAWNNLLRAASHMPYRSKKGLMERGYTCIRVKGER